MQLDTGLLNGIVLQRNRNNASDARLAGRSGVSGTVTARVTQGGKVVRGWARANVGRAASGRVEGRLRGLPIGGPYDVALTVRGRDGKAADGLTVHDVLVGDVWILGGQSNMEGIGWLVHDRKPDPLVRAFYMHDEWKVAKDPIHNLAEAVDPVHVEINGGVRPVRSPHIGIGPGVAFGHEMRRLTGVPQGLIACAHGGTSMAQWSPTHKRRGGHSLYGAMLRRFTKNGGRVAGVVWYQGESDAQPTEAPQYTNRMQQLVGAMRRDLGDAALPFAMVQIAAVCGPNWEPHHWNSIQDQQRRLPERVRGCAVVPAIDLALDDAIHVSGFDQWRLGKRLANAMQVLRHGKRAGQPPIAVKRVRVAKAPGPVMAATADVTVEFANVVGALRAAGRPAGFEIGGPDPTAAIYRVDLEGNCAVLRTMLPLCELDGGDKFLHYGYGTAPYCNITDEADRSLPVFGPVRIGRPKARTPYVTTLRVSQLRPCDARLETATYPRNRRRFGFRERTFPTALCDLHAAIIEADPNAAVYYACRIRCAEAMRLVVCLGYDGPVKVWIDGGGAFHDADGTTPIVPDKAAIPLAAEAGSHEVVVALGSNRRQAFGIFLRFERLDVSAKRLEEGPEHCRLPTVVG